MTIPSRHRADVITYQESSPTPASRELLVEAPLRIVFDGAPVATLMRTPGEEEDLALGFLLTEGFIASPGDAGAISFCRDGAFGPANEVRVTPASGVSPRRKASPRRIYSSCALCDDDLIEEAAADLVPFRRLSERLTPDAVYRLAERMRDGQELFQATGCPHGALLAESPNTAAERRVIREDIGRHNALDKAVGASARRGFDFRRCLVVMSGRLSFEMVAKAARAGLSDVAGVSAPSVLAVRLAQRLNMFLAGFVRRRAMTVYAGADALSAKEGPVASR